MARPAAEARPLGTERPADAGRVTDDERATATAPPLAHPPVLGPAQTALLRALDAHFASWGTGAGAQEILPPPLYPVSDLQKFDVYTNFPHLALVASPLDLTGDAPEPRDGRFAPQEVLPATLGLPHATCYGAYLYYEGTEVADETLVTLVNRCFRREEHYDGLRRLLSFHMRETVALGGFEHTQRVLGSFAERTQELAAALGLTMEKVPASDPFFDSGGSRALLAKLSPVKYEFQVDGLAIASVNTHRNFFGERCDIRLSGSGDHAFTGCAAFGLERWVSVLSDLHGGDAVAALEHLRDAARRSA
ncbi:hypothetical protein ABT160_29665 [Streptomyces sp. NPDC001941]|uniref:hypothetical protein n=1 Tax=Streptomyces sp. NPDC001941 TaxID=3154659 RepID=UPI00332D8846